MAGAIMSRSAFRQFMPIIGLISVVILSNNTIIGIDPEHSNIRITHFNITGLQKDIEISRHSPVCVLFKEQNSDSENEQKESLIIELWDKKNLKELPDKYYSWKVGSLSVNKARINFFSLWDKLPIFRCYLSQSKPFNYRGNFKVQEIQSWMRELVLIHGNQLVEATVEEVERVTSQPGITVIGLATRHTHYTLEDDLEQTAKEWSEAHVFFGHPQATSSKMLLQKYELSSLPALIFIENSVKTMYRPRMVHSLKQRDVTKEQIDIYFTARTLTSVHINQENFEDVILSETRHYVPTLALFYTHRSPNLLSWLHALNSLKFDLAEKNLKFKIALVEVTTKSKAILQKWVKYGLTTQLPYCVLFNIKFEKTTVVGIDQNLLKERPSPSTVANLLQKHGVKLKSIDGEECFYKPWKSLPQHEYCHTYEGPLGSMCFISTHNQTDNQPVMPVVSKKKLYRNITEPKKTYDWHAIKLQQASTNLARVGGLLLVTTATWELAIDHTAALGSPFNIRNERHDDVTKIIMIIFIMAECSSCQRNMGTFEQLQKEVDYIAGGAVYLANCTLDPDLCVRHKVTGFPTILALRSLGWQSRSHCLNENSWRRHVRLDYHGVLLVKPVMDWFSFAAAAAINNLNFQLPQLEHMKDDVNLVALLMPKTSNYLPRIAKRNLDYFFPYECFRAVCEHLYGQSGCYVYFSDRVPSAEFDKPNQEMIVTQVELWRKDGLKTVVSQLGRTLTNTLAAEESEADRQLHPAHRYEINPQQKCEDDHVACTQLLVDFTEDHGRLPVTTMTDRLFHTSDNLVFQDNLPVLVALVQPENITEETPFHKTLQLIGRELYRELVVVTVDVSQYTSWANQFVPRDYTTRFRDPDSGLPPLFSTYPRLCVISWNNHHRAAFYPPVLPFTSSSSGGSMEADDIVSFFREVQQNPEKMLVETEHF